LWERKVQVVGLGLHKIRENEFSNDDGDAMLYG
jgi:hypothetical protein